MSLRTALNVVLHQTRYPGNLGAVARLMANFGFQRWTFSDLEAEDLAEAEKMAIKGEALDLLTRARRTSTVAEAVADCVYAVGTSMRTLDGRAPLTPEQAVAKLREQAAKGPVALVFGGEKRGLSDEELAFCQDTCAIPTQPAQPSMNLAQSAAVLLYLCARDESELPVHPGPPPAHLRILQVLEAQLRSTLLQCEFLSAQQPEFVLRELMQSLGRAQLTQREAELWTGAFKQLARGRWK